ncbi:MAG: hypothetical protein ABJG78_10075 [Cyclobacteriaceae bacterium]
MKTLVITLLLLCSLAGISQRRYMYGVVRDSVTKEEILGAHIRNLSAKKLAIADEYAQFRIPAQVGDTLMFSHVGFQVLGWVVQESWFEKKKEFLLTIDTVYLEEVVIGEFPEYSRFKQMIVDTDVEDTSFWYHGVPQTVMQEHNVLEKKDINNPIYMATHPISFLHHSFSKKAKEQRKMQQINKNQHFITKSRQKFTREWVGEMTQLEGDHLTDFIAYCKFTPKYLAETELFFIHEKMMALLDDFMQEHSEG